MTAELAVPVRVRCLPSQRSLQNAYGEYSSVSRGPGLTGADSLRAVIGSRRRAHSCRALAEPRHARSLALIPQSSGFDDTRVIKTIRATARPQTRIEAPPSLEEALQRRLRGWS
jgi:hypothetical protein